MNIFSIYLYIHNMGVVYITNKYKAQLFNFKHVKWC